MKDTIANTEKDGKEDSVGGAAPGGNTIAPGRRGTLTLDVEKYQHYLDDADLTDDQKRAVIEALWSIIVTFVDLGFGVEPAQQSCGQRSDTVTGFTLAAADAVEWNISKNRETMRSPGRKRTAKARKS